MQVQPSRAHLRLRIAHTVSTMFGKSARLLEVHLLPIANGQALTQISVSAQSSAPKPACVSERPTQTHTQRKVASRRQVAIDDAWGTVVT